MENNRGFRRDFFMQRSVLLWVIGFSSLCSGLVSFGEEKSPVVTSSVRHGVEVEVLLINGLAYRYQDANQNVSFGLGARKANGPGLDGFVNYQRRIGSFPLEAVAFTSHHRTTESVEDFGDVRVSNRNYQMGLGIWFSPIFANSLYVPMSIGMSYPLYIESQLESDTTEKVTARRKQDLGIYARLGVGYAF